MAAISHFLMLAFKPEKWGNWLKLLISSLTNRISLKKKVESSVQAVYRKTYWKISIPLLFSLVLTKTKRTSKAKINS